MARSSPAVSQESTGSRWEALRIRFDGICQWQLRTAHFFVGGRVLSRPPEPRAGPHRCYCLTNI